MKKILSTMLLTALITGSLVACGGIAPSTSSGSAQGVTKEGEVVTLKISHNMDYVSIPDSVIAAADRLEKRYEAEGRSITINFEQDYQRIDWNEYHNNLIFSEKSGTGPDLFHLSGDVFGLVNAGLLMDVSEIVDDAFVDGIFGPVTIDGVVYGMPFDMPLQVLYYNESCLETIGWTAAEIEALPQRIAKGEFSFEEFMALAVEVKEKGAATWGITHRPSAGADFNNMLTVLGVEQSDANNTVIFDEKGVSRFFQHIYDNANVTKITPPDLNQMGWGTINELVGRAESFAYYGPISTLTYIANSVNVESRVLAEKISMVLFPVSEHNDAPFSLVYPNSMGINANTEHPEICIDLFKELANGGADLLAAHAAKIDSLSSVKAANALPEITQNYLLQRVDYMADYVISPSPCRGDELYMSELHKQILLLELGQATPEQAVIDFKTQLELNLAADEIIFK